MPLDILLTVAVTAIIQSIFGVGVLLFGTPILLLFGYQFIDALIVLLPISIAINSFQILKHYQHIDLDFYKNVLIFTIPLVVLFLFFVTSSKININFIIGLFLVFVALKNFFPAMENILQSMVKYQKIYLGVMGIIHGLTNLGGSLLTAIVHGKNYPKDVTRVTVAVCYATFAVFQIITLMLAVESFEISYPTNMAFLQFGVIIYLLTEEWVYTSLDNEKYSKIFGLFLLSSGLLLIFKAF